jgi:phosphatidate cytidylyltransferase
MNEVLKRSFTGLVFIALVTSSIWAGRWVAAFLFGLAAVIGTVEYFLMTASDRNDAKTYPDRIKGMARLSVGSIYLGAVLWSSATWIAVIAVLGAILAFNYLRFSPSKALWFEALFPVLYICLPLALVPIMIHHFDNHSGQKIMTSFFVLLWTNDTMAYVAGRLFGRHKLFERLSPKKTIEGFIGGLIFSVVAGLSIHAITDLFTAFDWAVLACLVAVFGTLGDLIESGLKRSAGVKDSGTILPGHGGILDRFDGLFLSLPLFLGYLLIQYP